MDLLQPDEGYGRWGVVMQGSLMTMCVLERERPAAYRMAASWFTVNTQWSLVTLFQSEFETRCTHLQYYLFLLHCLVAVAAILSSKPLWVKGRVQRRVLLIPLFTAVCLLVFIGT